MSHLLMLGSAIAHVSMNPNYGADTGGYFHTTIKIPHGAGAEYHTTKLVAHVPRGVLSARPEVPAGWNVEVTEYTLPPAMQYVSHGRTVTTAPDIITWTAPTWDVALHTAHLMNIDVQTKTGCIFNDNATNTIWNGYHTLWWRVYQYSSLDGTIDHSHVYAWDGVLEDAADGTSPPWSATVYPSRPCPYVYIHAGTRCSVDHSATPSSGGMTWFNQYVPTVPNRGAIMHEQHVIELANEAALSAIEADDNAASASTVATLAVRVNDLDSDNNTTLYLAVIALALASLSIGIILGLCCFRMSNKKAWAETIAAVPLTSIYAQTSTATIQKNVA